MHVKLLHCYSDAGLPDHYYKKVAAFSFEAVLGRDGDLNSPLFFFMLHVFNRVSTQEHIFVKLQWWCFH